MVIQRRYTDHDTRVIGMATEKSDETDISSTLKEILSEFKSQRFELNELKEQVRGQSQTVVSEVKKLKTETELSWKYEGNKKQYLFNVEVQDCIKQADWALKNGKLDYLSDVLSDCGDKLKQKQTYSYCGYFRRRLGDC